MEVSFIIKFIKFCAVGFSGVFIDFFITWLIKEKIHLNKYIANSSGFIVAATSNYFINRFWTFHSHRNDVAAEYFSFIGIAMIGLVFNNLIIYFLNEKMKINFYIAKIVATLFVTIWNFFANYFFTFK
jgi:putative flippase GtrA